jgi:tellurite resistance protein
MTIWTKKGTQKIAGVATNFLDDAAVLPAILPKQSFQEEEPIEILIERIKILATLMEQNGSIKEEELTFLLPVIQNAPISESEKKYLLTEAKRMGSQFQIDYNAIKSMPDAVDDLLTDMVILAKRDGEVDANELAYMKETAQLLGEPEDELMALLNT